MANIENAQKNEVTEIAQVNEVPEANVVPIPGDAKSGGHKADCPKIRLGGTLEQTCMLVLAIIIAAVSIFDANWKGLVPAGICAVFYFVPIGIKAIRKRKRINVEKVCDILKKNGITPTVCGDEIRWTYNGKESVLRIRSYCQVEILREYDIPPIPAVINGNEKAALETMKEVYLAKVAVLEDSGRNKLTFSTESLCVSMKELSAYIPMCIDILDFAEKRQQEHIAEIHNSGRGPARKIGFEYPGKEDK